MNRNDIIRIAREAGLHIATDVNWMPIIGLEYAKKFAALVIANHPPQSYMTWQEGYEAGKQTEREAWEHRYARLQSLMDVRETQPNKPCCLAEREACAKVCEDAPEPDGADLAEHIRARGQA